MLKRSTSSLLRFNVSHVQDLTSNPPDQKLDNGTDTTKYLLNQRSSSFSSISSMLTTQANSSLITGSHWFVVFCLLILAISIVVYYTFE